MYDLEKVISMDSLYKAWQKISQKNAAPGLDGIDLSLYRTDLQKNLRTLQTSVSTRNYRPYSDKHFSMKNRIISVSSLEDKIIQTALSEAILVNYEPAKSVHGFVRNRSIFTAKKTLDNALADGVYEYIKVDIKRFYDSIDTNRLYEILVGIFPDEGLLQLFGLLISAHNPGLSTGSCLSPALSNLYLNEFDHHVEENSLFYSRYVDDMLVSPTTSLPIIQAKLAEVELELNSDKSDWVNADEGFRYLGFEIKRDLETAIQNGDFSLAEALFEPRESDITLHERHIQDGQQKKRQNPQLNNQRESGAEQAKAQSLGYVQEPTEEQGHGTVQLQDQEIADEQDEYTMPNTIRNVVRKCHIVGSIVEKAKEQHYVPFAEKTHLLQIFHCLGDDGANFIHHVLSHCDDYDYAETQRRISKYRAYNPVGCKKLRERIDDDTRCICNFHKEKIYPTPIIHALRVDPGCYIPAEPKDNLGHFKAKNPLDKATDALTSMLELNRKHYEIAQQQEILKGQIEDLFQRNNTLEIQTPQGLVIKTDDGIFIKVG